MEYYLKYIKYKNKYLALKGGKIPEIEDTMQTKKYLPLNYSDHTLTLNNKVIKDGNSIIYNLNSKFEYELNEGEFLSTIVKDYYLFYNQKIIIKPVAPVGSIPRINDIEMPFETIFLDNSFNIIGNLFKLFSSIYITFIFIKIMNEEDIKIVNDINLIINNKCNESLYYDFEKDYNYNVLKKQINNDIIFLNNNKDNFPESLDSNHNKVSLLKSQIDELLKESELLKNSKKEKHTINCQLRKTIKEYSGNESHDEISIKTNKEHIDKYIKEIRELEKQIRELEKNIDKINNDNKLIMNIDERISNIINFKMIVSDGAYNLFIDAEVYNKITKLIKDIYDKYFIFDVNYDICIGISVKPNLLNKYIFINKFRELLEILYSDSNTDIEIETQILNLYGNNKEAFINISDMMELYENAIDSNQYITDDQIKTYSLNINNKTNTEKKIKAKYNAYIKNEIKLIMELKEFIKYCNIIDNTDGLNEFLKIKTSIIFFATFISIHFNRLTFPKLDNFVFPTNIDNIICNLLNINNDDLNSLYTELHDKTNSEKQSNIEFINLKESENKLNENELQNTINLLEKLYENHKILEKSYENHKILDTDVNKKYLDDLKKKYPRLTKIEIQKKIKKKAKLLTKIWDQEEIQIDEYKNKIILLKEKIDEINKEMNLKYINYDIYNINILPKIFRYGNADFENNKFADCVENTLLHFIRAIIWDPTTQNYNTEFLPKTSIPKLKDFVKLINIDNENTQEIKNEFNKIIQNQKDEWFKDVYKRNNNGVNYEIKSNIEIFETFLYYLFGNFDNFLFGNNFKNNFGNKFNNNNEYIDKLYKDNNNIIIKYKNISYFSLIFNISEGHSYVTKDITNSTMLSNYTYINLVYLLSSNYRIYQITNFNLYDKYLKNYIDDNKNLPFYLVKIMLTVDVYENLESLYLLYNRNRPYFDSYNYRDLFYEIQRALQ
jgi:hypothetical protein